jgi:putative transcriptional regulator
MSLHPMPGFANKPRTLVITILATLTFLAFANSPGDAFRTSLAPLPASESQEMQPASGMFLVARRSLTGPIFRRTVVLLLDHDMNGSLGLVVNRKISSTLADLVPDIESEEAEKHRMFFGGPVGTHQVFMLLSDTDPMPGVHQIATDVYFSADRQVLEKLLERKASDSEFHAYLGYAGWSAGQLVAEIERGSWELIQADPEAIFDNSDPTLWERLINKLEPLGIEVKRDSSEHRQGKLYSAWGY